MNVGEFLTSVTIWISALAYVSGAAIFVLSRGRSSWDAAGRVIWTVACSALLAHVFCAFQFYHHWSHAAAYLATAEQTSKMVNLNWGGGLYFNYAFLIGWIADIAWWWLRGLESYRQRPWLLLVLWHSFILFMFFNATVIFESGPQRWAGWLLCVFLCIVWLNAARHSANPGARLRG